MLKFLCSSFLLIGSSLHAAGVAPKVHWRPVVAPKPAVDSCWLVKTETALESQLKKLGWTTASKDFPKLVWGGTNIAAIVTAANRTSEPVGISVSKPPAARVTIYLSIVPARPNSGVLVVAVNSSSDAQETCGVEYINAGTERPVSKAINNPSSQSHSGGSSVSVTSAGSADEPVPDHKALSDSGESMKLQNESSVPISRLFLSNPSANGWQEYSLGSSALMPGRTTLVAGEPGRYDVNLVRDDETSCILRNVDLTGTLMITDDLLMQCESK